MRWGAINYLFSLLSCKFFGRGPRLLHCTPRYCRQVAVSKLAETKRAQLSSLPAEVTHKTDTTMTATSRGTMLSHQLIKQRHQSREEGKKAIISRARATTPVRAREHNLSFTSTVKTDPLVTLYHNQSQRSIVCQTGRREITVIYAPHNHSQPVSFNDFPCIPIHKFCRSCRPLP